MLCPAVSGAVSKRPRNSPELSKMAQQGAGNRHSGLGGDGTDQGPRWRSRAASGCQDSESNGRELWKGGMPKVEHGLWENYGVLGLGVEAGEAKALLPRIQTSGMTTCP